MRELRNVLEQAVAGCRGNLILATHLPRDLRLRSPTIPVDSFPSLDAALQEWLDARLRQQRDYAALLDELESRTLALLLPRFGNKPTHLARMLNVNRATLRRLLRPRDEPEPPSLDPSA